MAEEFHNNPAQKSGEDAGPLHWAPTHNVSLVINGGKKEVSCSTVPIAWGFTDALLDSMLPKYLVFVVQTKAEADDVRNNLRNGQRLLVPVPEGCLFLPLYDPGEHTISVLTFSEADKAVAQKFMEGSVGEYKYAVFVEEIADTGEYESNPGTVAKFSIPAVFFATPPSNSWVNTWIDYRFTKRPKDSCGYGKRAIYAFSLKIFIEVLILLMIGLLYLGATLYVLGVTIGLAFFGYKPDSPMVALKEIYQEGLSMFDARLIHYRSYPHRQWGKNKATGKPIRLWMTPFEIAICIGVIYVMTLLPVGFIIGVVGTVILGVSILGMVRRHKRRLKENTKQHAEEMKNLQEEREADYREYLRTNAHAAHMPESVDFMHAPKAYGTSRRTVQVLTASYWTLKSKWCKPYAKGAN